MPQELKPEKKMLSVRTIRRDFHPHPVLHVIAFDVLSLPTSAEESQTVG